MPYFCLSLLLFPIDETTKLEPVVQQSSSPGLVQSEAPVERLESNANVPQPSSIFEPGLPFPSTMDASTAVPLSVDNKTEDPSAKESIASASCSFPSVGEHKPSLPQPQAPITDKTFSDTPQTLAALPALASKALNGLIDSGTELDSPAHEPSLLSTAAYQDQTCAPAYRDASSSEMLCSDVRPDVPIAAALTPMAPMAVVPVTLTSSPATALSGMLPPGLPPLVQATTEADELNKSLDIKDIVPMGGTEAHGSIADGKTESQQQALTRKSPTIGIVLFQPQ